jgi:hypothetical protein
MVTMLRSLLMPRTMMPTTSPSASLFVMPGIRMRNVPMLRSATLPNASDAITVFTLLALRCCVMAAALPSRSPATTNLSSL